jgi:hypothetical protein
VAATHLHGWGGAQLAQGAAWLHFPAFAGFLGFDSWRVNAKKLFVTDVCCADGVLCAYVVMILQGAKTHFRPESRPVQSQIIALTQPLFPTARCPPPALPHSPLCPAPCIL